MMSRYRTTSYSNIIYDMAKGFRGSYQDSNDVAITLQSSRVATNFSVIIFFLPLLICETLASVGFGLHGCSKLLVYSSRTGIGSSRDEDE